MNTLTAIINKGLDNNLSSRTIFHLLHKNVPFTSSVQQLADSIRHVNSVDNNLLAAHHKHHESIKQKSSHKYKTVNIKHLQVRTSNSL